MDKPQIILEFGFPVNSYKSAIQIAEYMNVKHPDIHHYVKKINDKYRVLFKVKNDKKIIHITI